MPVFPARAMALLIFVALLPGSHAAAESYLNAKTLKSRIKEAVKENKKIVRFESLVETPGKRNVWVLELGGGDEADRKNRPAMLVVAGIEGNDLAGTNAAVSWTERLIQGYGKNDAIKKLLDSTTIYVFPRLNPDAAEKYFEKPRIETSTNDKPFDDDHDGLVDEDPAEDLNGDGLIASMRIEDPEGEYILDPREPRLLMKADPAKGEKGAWRLLSEGKDNDGDEVWNEDGLGGVNFNRNFPYNYEYFGAAAGLHPVSEIETRALADFVVAHPNIGIVFTFGAADNLLKTPDAAKDEGAKSDEKRTTMGRRMNTNKPATGIDEDDIGYYRELGETYRKALGLDKELKNAAQGGSFSDWMYFHRGRFSLAAQAWSAAEQIEIEKCAQKKEKEAGEKKDDKDKPEVDAAKADEKKPDEKTDEKKPSGEKREGDKDDKRNEDERAALKWFDDHAPSAFLPWKPFDHPDFKGRRAEIGGYAPYALSNPPEDLLGGVATKEADFLTTLALRLPRVGIRKIETKHLGKSVYEVKIQVENTGYLPTVLAHGETTGEVLPTRLTLELEDAAFLSGSRITRLGPLKGSGGMQETLLTLRVPKRKRIALNVISALGGQASANLEIGGER